MVYYVGSLVETSDAAVELGFSSSAGVVTGIRPAELRPYLVRFDNGNVLYMAEDDLVPVALGYGEAPSDPVQSPSHYDLPGGIQVIDLIRGESFLRGNALKYIFRAPHKGNELEDMRKGREYINWEIERLESERSS